jgi:predicted Fe-Mo cluster-binding NifX family protein
MLSRKFAVPVNNGVLDEHFGHCEFYAIFVVEEGNIISEELVKAPPHEPGLLPRWLAERGVTDVIAGGMGRKAIDIFNENNVNVFVGAPKQVPATLVKQFLDNSLNFVSNYCDH